MSKSNTFKNDLLKLIFNGVAIANIADNAITSPLTQLYLSLHTSDPGGAGDQASNEVTYTGYARIPVPRNGAGWVVTANSVSPANTVSFQEGSGGSGIATHVGVGTSPSGAGKLLYSGAIDPGIVCGNGVTPRITTTSTITED